MFKGRFRHELQETITLKDPQIGGANQWGSSESEIGTAKVFIVRENPTASATGGAVERIESDARIYFPHNDNRVKAKMNVHVSENEIYHITKLVKKRSFTVAFCENKHDPYG